MKKFYLWAILMGCFAITVSAAGAAQKNIVFVGDSISCGVGASNPQNRYTTLTVAMLNQAAGKNIYKEVNVAVSGSTMCEQLWPYKGASGMPFRINDVIRNNPAIVVIQHGVNDANVGNSISDFSWSYRHFVQQIKAKLPKVKIVCMTITPLKSDGSINSTEWLALCNTAIQEIAAKENTMLAHINLAMNNRMDLLTDGCHPNDAGYKIMAETLVKTIQNNDVKSENNFDFIIDRPGFHRICNWLFKVSEEAVANGKYVRFTNMGSKGWKYNINGAVSVKSPYNFYMNGLDCAQSDKAPVKFQFHGYHKAGMWDLVSTQGKDLKISVTAKAVSGKK